MPGSPAALGRRSLGAGRFLELETIRWRDASGTEREWETAERVGRREAVLLIPWLMPSRRLVLIRQYRPPIDAWVIEFPAGIVDRAGENAETAALRELAEETGYAGRVVRIIPPTYNTPGMTSESVYQMTVEIDESAPENRHPRPAPDAGEAIEVVAIPAGGLARFLEDAIAEGVLLDSKVAAFIQGFTAHG